MKATITLNEMRDQVGALLFGADWIGGLSDEDWDLIRGPYGLAKHRRKAEPRNYVDTIKACPASVATKLDRALGRWMRCGAQYSTADTWIEEHGLPVDPGKPADRRLFRQVIKQLRQPAAPKEKAKPGPKARILPRIVQQMLDDRKNRRLPDGGLEAMSEKELEFRYGAKRERVRAAREVALKK